MKKVKLDVIKPWITQKITELLGFEDEVLIGYINSLLEEKQEPDPKHLQINITGFLAKDATQFVLELWQLLISAQNNIVGIPPEFLEKKKEEIRARKAEQERVKAELSKKNLDAFEKTYDSEKTVTENGEDRESIPDTRKEKRHREDDKDRKKDRHERHKRDHSRERRSKRSRSRDRDRRRTSRSGSRDRSPERRHHRRDDRNETERSPRREKRRHHSKERDQKKQRSENDNNKSPTPTTAPDDIRVKEQHLREKALESMRKDTNSI